MMPRDPAAPGPPVAAPRGVPDAPELVEWGRGLTIGVALGCVVGVFIAYMLVRRFDGGDADTST